MILPHPESDLSLNIMIMGADIIKMLNKKSGFHLVENLMQTFLRKNKKRTPDMFMNALTFLFSFGLIEQKKFKVKLVPKVIEVQRSLF